MSNCRFLARVALVFAFASGSCLALADEGPGFDNISPETYSQMLVDAVQAHHGERYRESFTLFQRLACAGDKTSQEQLGLMYLTGEGVPKSAVKAYLWLALAAEYNFAPYRTTAKRVESVFTAEQMKTVAPLADDLRGRYGQRATNVTCNAQSNSSFSSNIKNSVVCSPKHGVSMLLVHRCYAEEQSGPALDH